MSKLGKNLMAFDLARKPQNFDCDSSFFFCEVVNFVNELLIGQRTDVVCVVLNFYCDRFLLLDPTLHSDLKIKMRHLTGPTFNADSSKLVAYKSVKREWTRD